MKTLELTISGMSCGHCVMAVEKELSKIESISVKSVEIGKATVAFDEEKVTEDKIRNAVDSAGYQITNMK